MPDSTSARQSSDQFVERVRPSRAVVVLAVSLAILVAAVPALGAEAGGSSSQPTPPFTGDSAFANAWQRSHAEQEQPSSPEQREGSATAYSGQSPSEALATASQEQPQVVLAPAWEAMTLSSGEQVEQYVGDHAARVDVPGQSSDVIVQSVLPLRAKTGTGQEQPVDLSLIDTGRGFAPRNPIVHSEAPSGANGATRLSDIDIGISAVGASADANGRQVADKVFYANAYTDTDVLVRPLPAGTETLFDLRSATSPESFALHFDLPAGDDLVAGSEGQDARITRAGQTLASVPLSIAWDADGRPVPVTAQVQGHDLALDISHQGGDWNYPIMLDPSTIVESANWYGGGTSGAGWHSEVGSPSNFWNAFGNGMWGNGLYTAGYANTWYNAGDWAAWVFDSPGATGAAAESYIYRADFTNVSFIPTVGIYDWSPLMRVIEGIWNTRYSRWESGTAAQPSPVVLGSSYDYYSTNHCLAEGCGPTSGSQSAGTPGNKIYFETWSPCSCYTSFPGPTAYMGGAAAWIADRTAPVSSVVETRVNGAVSTPPTRWVDAVDLSVVTKAHDRGLGLKSFNLSVPGRADLVRGSSCTGALANPCPNDSSDHRSDDQTLSGPIFDYSTADENQPMPEGIDTVTATVADAVGNVSTAASWSLKVDHNPPDLQLNGSLFDHRGQTLNPGIYRLTPTADDPHSGVKNLTIDVDDRQVYSDPKTCNANNECLHHLSGDYQFVTATQTPGALTITVRATDGLDHTQEKSFQVTVDYSADCPGVFVDHSAAGDPRSVESCPQADPNTFEGNCRVDGQTSYTKETGGILQPTELSIYAAGTGNCSGSLNGEPISAAPVKLTLRDDYTCAALSFGIDTHSPAGPGLLTFTQGTANSADDTPIASSFSLTGSQRTTDNADAPGVSAIQLSGVDDGTGVGVLTLAQHSWGGCSPRGDAFNSTFQTVTGLHDDA